MNGIISKTVVTTHLEVTRYNEETKKEEVVTKNFTTLRKPSKERIANWLLEDRCCISFRILSYTEEVYSMDADEFIKNAVKKRRDDNENHSKQK